MGGGRKPALVLAGHQGMIWGQQLDMVVSPAAVPKRVTAGAESISHLPLHCAAGGGPGSGLGPAAGHHTDPQHFLTALSTARCLCSPFLPQVAGLDVGWGQQLDMAVDERFQHRFALTRHLPPGQYQFKFIIVSGCCGCALLNVLLCWG